jgi:predicted RNA-binding Zn-ribbon protein involved in translation (DUF1610 family)
MAHWRRNSKPMTKKCTACGGTMYSPAMGQPWDCEACGEHESASKKEKEIKKLRRAL